MTLPHAFGAAHWQASADARYCFMPSARAITASISSSFFVASFFQRAESVSLPEIRTAISSSRNPQAAACLQVNLKWQTDGMKQLALISILAACSSNDEPKAVFACNLNGLTTAERTEAHQLLEQLGGAIVRVDERPRGYAFRIEEKRLSIASLARWVDLERRCCPFFHFAIEIVPDGGGTWLELTGADGVKDFIAAELGTPKPT